MSPTVRRRWILLCAIGVAVLALHAVALLLLAPAWFDPHGPAPAAMLQVRSVVWPAPAAAPAPPISTAPPARAQAAETRPPAAAAARAAVASAPALSPPDSGSASSAQTPAAVALVPDAAAAPAGTDLIDVPLYATALPPAGRWRYRLQRGLLVGDAQLFWAPQADASYELHLEGRIAGVTMLDWVSRGAIDAAGVAPDRFALRRRGRDAQAANFQRAAGKITFSGPTHELPLWPGAQDRLSWMVQLPAVVAAAPQQFAAGARIVLWVVGARGDADAWTFVVQGPHMLGATPTLRLLREPRRPYDTRVEVWLDPHDHFLPLRALLSPSGGGAALELQREIHGAGQPPP